MQDCSAMLQRVNTAYWYGEKDNILILLALIKNKNLKLSTPNRGIILNEDNSLYAVNGTSFTLGLDFIIGSNAEEMTSKLDLLQTEVASIIAWNKLQLSNNKPEYIIKKHKILLPTNINKSHWVALDLELEFEQKDAEFFLVNGFTRLYDSLSLNGTITSRINEILKPFLLKFAQQDIPMYLQGMTNATKMQIDGNSCGPITCKTIFDLLEGKKIPDCRDKYTIEETIELRAAHLGIINNEEFTVKQEKYVQATIRARTLNGNAFEQAECIYDFINKDQSQALSDVFEMLKKFIETDILMQNVNRSSQPLPVSEYEELDKKYKEQLHVVKAWLHTHYDSLCALNLVQNIFQHTTVKPSLDDIKWADNGKDTLVAVIKHLLGLPEYYQSKKIEEEKLRIAEQQQKARELLEKNELATLTKINIRTSEYEANGTLNKDGKPHTFKGSPDIFGNYSEAHSFSEELYNLYSYEGEFDNGKKVGRGKERFNPGFGFETWFSGVRSRDDGKLLDGETLCFVGDKMPNGYHLIYEGVIADGAPKGNGKIALAQESHRLAEIDVIFYSDNFFVLTNVSKSSLEADQNKNGNKEVSISQFIKHILPILQTLHIYDLRDAESISSYCVPYVISRIDNTTVADLPSLSQQQIIEIILVQYASRRHYCTLGRTASSMQEQLLGDFKLYMQNTCGIAIDSMTDPELTSHLQGTLDMLKNHLAANIKNLHIIFPEDAERIEIDRNNAIIRYFATKQTNSSYNNQRRYRNLP